MDKTKPTNQTTKKATTQNTQIFVLFISLEEKAWCQELF